MASRGTGLALLALLLAVAAVPTARAVVFADATDAPQVEEGVVGGSRPGLGTETDSATRGKREGAEQFVFQAEVNRLMDIIINSLYSNKDIFLRELISNASDALDKIRFLALTDKGQLGEGEAAKLDIQLSLDPSKKVLSIRDKGVGMTKEDLIKNLGTIAKSGTSGFLEQMQKGGDVNLIGQFGVGFYSVYLVADWVEVITKHNDDKQYVWQSTADGHFSIAEDDGEDIGRGTVINIHLKPEAQEYSEESKLKDLVHKYSEFIHFPIYLWTEKEVDVPVEEEDQKEEADQGEAKKDADDEEVADDESEDEEPEETPKKTRKEKRHEWELLNDSQAIWLRQPKDVSDEEYKKFYKTISQDYADPMGWVHFKGEGDVEFKATLFMPSTTPHEYYEKYYEKGAKGALKLYVRRVFITDDTGEELLPRWLGFLRGIVDSDTLPLNVSREMMQTSAALKTIKKKLVRKVLDLIKKWSDDELKCRKAEAGEEDEDEPAPTGEACEMYGKFWEQYGRAMKLGIVEDATNRNRMAKLLRFHTSKSLDKLTSLDEYVSRMKEGQKQIYYLAGGWMSYCCCF
ncbi:Hsp90 protein-domain-containing protein [Dunaliella salina]|uniref:Hsp90 protein-domain-containing protein n=1 Tax=Dunaliella salina TaxID=3046 RepID=A0ABQ7GD07_DUNSA|nr:Hsp90 protein-domain-containing protein [Dunaliella salina]|eukprot:KAF5832490.1 Hsp90 protein-domain-containing protein [Dunaliella salina]